MINKLPMRLGVGIILLNKDNEVFVGKRKDNPIDKWQMPQGGIDNNEKPLDAMKRELEEETSVTNIKILKEVNKKNKIYVEDGTIEFYENNLLILSTTATSVGRLDKNIITEKVNEAQKQLSKKELNDKQRYILNHKIDALNSLN